MLTIKGIVTFFFGLGFVFNASLFIPQAIKIVKSKSARDVSLITFAGQGKRISNAIDKPVQSCCRFGVNKQPAL